MGEPLLTAWFCGCLSQPVPERAAYTWWTNLFHTRERNLGWRIDYFLVSESLLERVKDVIIHTEVQGSDHCPVTLVLDG